MMMICVFLLLAGEFIAQLSFNLNFLLSSLFYLSPVADPGIQGGVKQVSNLDSQGTFDPLSTRIRNVDIN